MLLIEKLNNELSLLNSEVTIIITINDSDLIVNRKNDIITVSFDDTSIELKNLIDDSRFIADEIYAFLYDKLENIDDIDISRYRYRIDLYKQLTKNVI